MPYLDRLVIDNYNDDLKINTPELQKVYDYLQEHKELRKRVKFWFRRENAVLYSRGGQAPNKQGVKNIAVNVLCTQPFRQLIIRPTGEISLCCNDAFGKYTLGDISTQSIRDVWNSPEHQAIRTEMLKNGRKNLMLCAECDSLFGPHLMTSRQRP